LFRAASVANDFTSWWPSGRTVIIPFIQSVYCASVFTASSGSAWAQNVAFGVHEARHASHPLPVSHMAKKSLAALAIDAMCASPVQWRVIRGSSTPVWGTSSIRLQTRAAGLSEETCR
jgi:hypothetical protein